MKHVAKHNIIINYRQLAFQPRSNTITATYDFTNAIKNELDQKKTIAVVFRGMKKAFNAISKKKL